MSTIGGLYLPQFQPVDYGRSMNQGIAGAGGMLQNETALLALADAKRQQEEAAATRAFLQQHPEFVFGGGGPPQSLLSQLAPGGGPMTQQAFVGGQPPGAPQVVPGGQDLSRFAGVSPQGGGPIPPDLLAQTMPTVTPPQSTIGALGPQPQAQAPSPQQRLLELARTNPEAALKVQALMQGQQEQQWKLEERRLDMGVKVAEGVARELNSVRDQASLDAARERIRHYHPQAAAQIPQFYSKEALEPLIMKGVAVADLAKWRKDQATAQQTQMMTERLPRVFGALEQFATGGGGTQEPAPSPAPTAASPTGQQARTAPPEFESAITEANRLYPQVPVTRIKSIIAAESNFDPRAVSSAGAKGPMQLMDTTAKDMGVEDPFNVRQNVDGGTRYYAQLLTKYGGDERKALAAYNWGPANLDKVGGDVSKAPPETQAYVQKVLSGGGGGGGTGTAQAPATNPRVAQLDADIKRGNALTLQVSMIPGMETAAATLRAQVENLSQEKNRLDAPRQEYEKRLAVHNLELQQKREEGLSAAQVKADTEPASKEEIDAVNRALPRDKQVPYGTTRKQLREQGRVGGELLSPKVTEDLTNTTVAIQQFEELNNAVSQLPTGPLTQYVESFKERWGIDISDEKVAQRAILAGAANQLLQARSGAAINPSEYQRLMNELPNEGNDPKVFKARLANTVRQFRNIYKTRVHILRKTGHAIPDDLMEPLAAPEGPPAQKVSSNVDKFKAIKP